ncbi:hypothetical protein P4O66_015965, partial [Electrophorus voltai]
LVLVPVLPPSVLLMLAHVRSFGPLASRFGVGLIELQPDKMARRESSRWGGPLSWIT